MPFQRWSLAVLRLHIADCSVIEKPNCIRFKVTNFTVMLFRTGLAVVTGIKDESDCDFAVSTVVDHLHKVVHECYEQSFTVNGWRIKTILATVRLSNVVIDPYSLKKRSSFNITWEPEINNAVIVREGNVTIKLFPRTLSVVLFFCGDGMLV
jgi:TATA-box binding protein (TBP) (component of TFIID and TFIIIB)